MFNLIRFTKKFTSPSTPNLNNSRCEPRAEFLSLDLWREIPPPSQGEPGEVYIGLISTLFSQSCRAVAMNSALFRANELWRPAVFYKQWLQCV